MRVFKKAYAAAGTAALTALVSVQAHADTTDGGLDAAAVVDHLEGSVTDNIGLIGGAILIVGGLVYGVGVLRGFLKA